MQPVNLFRLATTQAGWLAARQAAVAGNIANVNTPGYRAVDVESFEKMLGGTASAMNSTQSGHFGASATPVSTIAKRDDDRSTATMPSGNTVLLEGELMKAGEVARAFELNSAIVKAFHRMTLSSLKV